MSEIFNLAADNYLNILLLLLLTGLAYFSRTIVKLIRSYKTLQYLLFVLLSAFLLWLTFRDHNLSKIISELSNVKYKWLIISIICGALAIVSRGLRWVYLIKALGYKSSKKKSINCVAIGYFTNILIPRAGEISRCVSLQKVEKIPFDKLFGTIILERVIDFIILIALILTTLLYKFEKISNVFNEMFDLDSFFKILICLILFFLTLFILKNLIKKLSFYKRLEKLINGIKEGLNSIKELDKKIPFFLHTIFIWLMYVLMTYICFFAIEGTEHLNFLDGIYTTVIGGLGMIVPTPGGFGSYHFAVEAGLKGIEISKIPAVLFPIAVHTSQTLMTIIFGLFSSFILLSNKKNVETTK